MKKKIKHIMIFIITSILLVFIMSQNVSAQATDNGTIKTNIIDNLKNDGTVAIEILLQDQKEGISAFTSYFEYDNELFESIDNTNIAVTVDESLVDSINYSSKTGKITIYFENDIENIEKICTVNLRLKQNINIENVEKVKIALKMIQTYSFDNDHLVDYEDIEDEKIIKSDNLYLISNEYKIGDNNINSYEDGDRFISRVVRNTTLNTFIGNLDTNGTIKVLKQDGTELSSDEIIGTGMTLEVTKDNQKISLQIAVMGDLSGEGQVTVQDLSALNDGYLRIPLENEWFIAADLDENQRITATDFAEMISILIAN